MKKTYESSTKRTTNNIKTETKTKEQPALYNFCNPLDTWNWRWHNLRIQKSMILPQYSITISMKSGF